MKPDAPLSKRLRAVAFFTRTRQGGTVGGNAGALDWTDWLSYAYLVVGLFMMFAPIVWLVMSSLKTESAINQFPPTFFPYTQKMVSVQGHEKPLPLYLTKVEGKEKPMAQIFRMGILATMVDPANPSEEVKVNIDDRKPINEMEFAFSNFTDVFKKFDFFRYLFNSVFITVIATLLTLLVNSMAAFALSKYQFRGQKAVFGLILATLMIPPTIILVPVFLVINQVGLLNSLWGVILPAIATPTGVFLLRQYMLTIPDEILEAARMDNASEWRIYWKIILPLSAPALAVLAIFSVMWRWNDFLLPLIVLSKSEFFTLQLALNSFQGELNTQWHYLLAMTVITIIPITLVFGFLQKYITTGIASAGVK
jgi:alpha-1,4-digalacturonate transport system permease protein